MAVARRLPRGHVYRRVHTPAGSHSSDIKRGDHGRPFGILLSAPPLLPLAQTLPLSRPKPSRRRDHGCRRRDVAPGDAHARGGRGPPRARVPDAARLPAAGAMEAQHRRHPDDTGWNRATGAKWAAFFADRHAVKIARYEGQGQRPSPGRFNIDGRWRFWSGRTMAAVLAYIAACDHPRLETPPPPPPAPAGKHRYGGSGASRSPAPALSAAPPRRRCVSRRSRGCLLPA